MSKQRIIVVGNGMVGHRFIENLMEKCDNLIIGGGMTYTFIKAMGGDIGSSLCEEDKLELAAELIEKAKAKGVNLLLPVDNVAAEEFGNDAKTKITAVDDVPEGWMGLDIGPETIKLFSGVIAASKTIVWNGPM
ncbi:hypothetical protein LCGC14_3167550, partial [marine sediment metagenome]